MAGLIAGLLTMIAMALGLAQTPVAFDVASIKESKTFSAGGNMRLLPGGGIAVEHLPPRNLITIAYHLQPYQLIGAPEWTRDTSYDINAKPAEASTRDQIFLMLQALLSDRFKLSFHRENRQMDGYALVRARADELGPALTPSAVDCEKAFATTPRCREGGFGIANGSNSLKAVGIPLWSLLQLIIGQVGGPVSDETRLTGTYDVDLRWSTEVAPADDLRSIFTALQEQLGLKLERRRVTTDVVVVDHIERPSPD
jgi:uncharacterized protein (TIGR03435 family)